MGGEGLGIADLPVRLGASPSDVAACLGRHCDDVVRIGSRVFDRGYRDELVSSLAEAVAQHHRRSPLDPGVLLQTIRARIVGRPELLDDAVRTAVIGGHIETIENGGSFGERVGNRRCRTIRPISRRRSRVRFGPQARNRRASASSLRHTDPRSCPSSECWSAKGRSSCRVGPVLRCRRLDRAGGSPSRGDGSGTWNTRRASFAT